MLKYACLLACAQARVMVDCSRGPKCLCTMVCDCDPSQVAKQIATVEEGTTTQISLLHGCLGMSAFLRNIALEGTLDCVVDGMPALNHRCCQK